MSYSFFWSGIPFFTGTDIVKIVWNDWDLRGNSGKITYRYVGGGATKTETPTLKNLAGRKSYGRGHTFPVRREYNFTKDVYFAKSGTGFFNLRHSGRAKNLSVYASYGHTTIGTNTIDEDWADGTYTIIP